MSYDYLDEMLDRQYEAMEEFAQERLRETSLTAVRTYLGTYGDAIQQRVKQNIDGAQALLQSGFPSAALVEAATAIELTIRFLLVRPLVQGAFLSDAWAGVLADRIGTGRTAEDRKILPQILEIWKIDVASVRLRNGDTVWPTITDNILPARNRVVHEGETVAPEIVDKALECCNLLIDKVVQKIAAELGFTIDRTGKWAEIHEIRENPFGATRSWQRFTPASPFPKKSP